MNYTTARAESTTSLEQAFFVSKEMDTGLLELINKVSEKGSLLRGVDRNNLIQCRRSVLKEYMIFMKGLCQSQKAQLLVDYAYAKGWTDRDSLTGTQMKELAKGNRIAAWMTAAAFELLTEKGWRPRISYYGEGTIQSFEDVFALFMHYWVYYKGPFSSVEEVIRSLPEGVDKGIAKTWANFFVGRLGLSNNLKLKCFLVDKYEGRIGEIHNSFVYLAREFSTMKGAQEARISYSYTEVASDPSQNN